MHTDIHIHTCVPMYLIAITNFTIYPTDFAELKAQYHTILQLMPDSYAITVGDLQHCISFDQICVIFSSSNSAIANKLILDFLIERVSCRQELIDLCDQLEKITTMHTNEWKVVINKIRSG